MMHFAPPSIRPSVVRRRKAFRPSIFEELYLHLTLKTHDANAVQTCFLPKYLSCAGSTLCGTAVITFVQ